LAVPFGFLLVVIPTSRLQVGVGGRPAVGHRVDMVVFGGPSAEDHPLSRPAQPDGRWLTEDEINHHCWQPSPADCFGRSAGDVWQCHCGNQYELYVSWARDDGPKPVNIFNHFFRAVVENVAVGDLSVCDCGALLPSVPGWTDRGKP
jgi:hypothetical protein